MRNRACTSRTCKSPTETTADFAATGAAITIASKEGGVLTERDQHRLHGVALSLNPIVVHGAAKSTFA